MTEQSAVISSQCSDHCESLVTPESCKTRFGSINGYLEGNLTGISYHVLCCRFSKIWGETACIVLLVRL